MQEVLRAAGPETRLETINSPKKWVCRGHRLWREGWWGQVAPEGAC